MLQFLAQNWGTILVCAAVAAAILCAVLKLRARRKKGQGSCGCGCGTCPSAGLCRKQDE